MVKHVLTLVVLQCLPSFSMLYYRVYPIQVVYIHTMKLPLFLYMSGQSPNIVFSSSVSTLAFVRRRGFLTDTTRYLCWRSGYSACPAPSSPPRIAQEGDFVLSASLQCSRMPSGWLRYCTMLEKDGRLSASGFLDCGKEYTYTCTGYGGWRMRGW